MNRYAKRLSVSVGVVIALAATVNVAFAGVMNATSMWETTQLDTVLSSPTQIAGAGQYEQWNLNAVVAFQLPDLGAGSVFENATLSVPVSCYWDSLTPYAVDLYGLMAGANSAPASAWYYGGGSTIDPSPNASLIQANVASFTNVPKDGQTHLVTSSGSTLLTYLNDAYDGGAGAGKYVFFRFNPEGYLSGVLEHSFFWVSDGKAQVDGGVVTGGPVPTLTYNVPEPSVLMLLSSGLFGLLCYAWRRRK